ncbi:hypothetical protein BJ165DRAFT_760364 [Panaeolus papilionaceus]|nr:hypothetical protein BJ165DRAFT_760364 [Panaeolus papilionaceus]
MAEIFASSRLQHLEIQGSYVDYYGRRARTLPTSNITSVSIPPGAQFPLTTLFALPNLEILHFSSFFHGFHDVNDHRAPSFRLKELRLVIQNAASIQFFLDFYLNHARKCGKEPFAHLEVLDITKTPNERIQPLQTLLTQEFSLKTFRFKNQNNISLPIPDLIPSLSQKLATCTTVCLDLTRLQDSLPEHDPVVNAVTDMFSSLAGNNALESLELSLKSLTTGDPCSDWTRLRTILPDESAFPALKEARINGCPINFALEQQKICV